MSWLRMRPSGGTLEREPNKSLQDGMMQSFF